MLIPGTYDWQIPENAGDAQTFTISGITTTTGYSAAIDIRNGNGRSAALVLSLSDITLSASPAGLAITVRISSTERNTILTETRTQPYWSLKVTGPDAIPLQYLVGKVLMIRTTTP